MEFQEPPCEVEETIQLVVQLDKLHRYLNYLSENDKLKIQKIKDLNIKISEIDDLKVRFDENDLKMEAYEKRFIEIEKTLVAHQSKIMEYELKIKNLFQITDDHQNKIKSVTDKTNSNEENINTLNRLTDENAKNCNKLNENLERLKFQQELTKDQMQTLDKRLNMVNANLDENVKQMKEFQKKTEANLEKKISEIKDLNKENFEKINKKMLEAEGSIGKLLEASDVNGGRRNLGGNDVNSNYIMSELMKNTKAIEELKNDKNSGLNHETEKKLNDLKNQINLLNGKVDKIKTSTEETVNQRGISEEEDKVIDIDKQQINSTMSNDVNENIHKLNENLKIISQNLGYKATKDELEAKNKLIKLEMEKIIDKFSGTIKYLESRLKNVAGTGIGKGLGTGLGTETYNESILNSYNEGNVIISNDVQEHLERIAKEIFEREISSFDFNNNNNFKDSQSKTETNKIEIEKLYESIIDIRKNCIENSPYDRMIKEANDKIVENESIVKEMNIKLEEVIKNLDGDNNQEGDHSGVGSIREFVRNLATTSKILSERIDKVSAKQDNMNSEILAKVKKDLLFESTRILDDFKQDLKSSINKIEDQLREKVDRFNLDEFGRRIDSKFNNEMNKKLDRNDLKKNNNLINRKIDTLENKISKTLVDTLMDLQMEEAPLITKKTAAGEKCASCNQSIPHHHMDGILNNDHKSNLHKTSSKFQTSNYRVGEVKINNNIINESPDEEGHGKKIQLPDINSNRAVDFQSTLYNNNKKKNNPTSPNYPPNFNPSVINEDLDKKYLGPNDLIKSVNKAFDKNK